MDPERTPTSRLWRRWILAYEFTYFTSTWDEVNLNASPMAHLRELLEQPLAASSSINSGDYLYDFPHFPLPPPPLPPLILEVSAAPNMDDSQRLMEEEEEE